MGVLGLTPFLQKSFPGVIKHLPDRLKALSGKTVVIDGTLITQRLHFAQTPHPYRHVLGWYRLVKELKECGVRTICVFDGHERSLAKSREAERRKDVQKLAVARNSIEHDRLRRLRQLSSLLDHYTALGVNARQRILELLQNLTSASAGLNQHEVFLSLGDLEPWVTLLDHEDWEVPDDLLVPVMDPVLGMDMEPLDHQIYDYTHPTDIDDPGLYDFSLLADGSDELDTTSVPASSQISGSPALSLSNVGAPNLSKENSPDQPLETPECVLSVSMDGREKKCPIMDRTFAVDPVPFVDAASVNPDISKEESLRSAFASLYLDYKNSTSTLTSLTVPPLESDPDQAEYTMTRHQLRLTLEEGQLWDRLLTPLCPTGPTDTRAKTSLALLAERSNLMLESFQRRVNPPTKQTYEESRAMLNTMGIPCVEATGPFEAEALAASLVINGLADYVASEDTDVLVYEAPMIRNITSRASPLVIVSGKEVRAVLNLSRASYVDFALLLGTDFSQRIKNIGPQRALKFIREHGSIEHIIERETKYRPRVPADEYLEEVGMARSVFQTLPPVPEERLLETQEGDEAGIVEMLQRYGLHRAAAYEWNHGTALDGNYFEDDPSVY